MNGATFREPWYRCWLKCAAHPLFQVAAHPLPSPRATAGLVIRSARPPLAGEIAEKAWTAMASSAASQPWVVIGGVHSPRATPTSAEDALRVAYGATSALQRLADPGAGPVVHHGFARVLYRLRKVASLQSCRGGPLAEFARQAAAVHAAGACVVLSHVKVIWRLSEFEGSREGRGFVEDSFLNTENAVRDAFAWSIHIATLPTPSRGQYRLRAETAWAHWRMPAPMSQLVHSWARAVRPHLPVKEVWETRNKVVARRRGRSRERKLRRASSAPPPGLGFLRALDEVLGVAGETAAETEEAAQGPTGRGQDTPREQSRQRGRSQDFLRRP